MQKRPRIEVKALRDLAHTAPCFATFVHPCNAHDGCHPAHNNWQQWGKGVGKKTSDWAVAFMCGNAHREIDGKINSTMSRDQRQYEWLNAFISTQDYLWQNKLLKVA